MDILNDVAAVGHCIFSIRADSLRGRAFLRFGSFLWLGSPSVSSLDGVDACRNFIFQNILFLDLILVQLVFVDWAWVRKVMAKQVLSRRESIEFLYDGQCPLCRRTVRIFRVLDLFEQLRYTDFRQINLEAYNRQYNLNLTLADMDREMYVLDRGRPYVGFYAYRLMGLRIPALWPIVPWLFIPGITHIGVAVYRYIARERLKLLRCDDTCAVQINDLIRRTP